MVNVIELTAGTHVEPLSISAVKVNFTEPAEISVGLGV